MKILTKFFFAFSLLIFPVSTVNAATIAPSSGTYSYGSQVTLVLTATSVLAGQTAINLDLTFSNASVVSYTPPSGGNWATALSGTPQCNGTALFSSTKVCAALTKTTGTIAAGESLGSVTIEFDVLTGTSTVVKTTNNIYLNGDNDTEDVDDGTIATFTVSGTIPNASLRDPVGRTIVFVGLALVGVGLLLFRIKTK